MILRLTFLQTGGKPSGRFYHFRSVGWNRPPIYTADAGMGGGFDDFHLRWSRLTTLDGRDRPLSGVETYRSRVSRLRWFAFPLAKQWPLQAWGLAQPLSQR